MQDTLQPTQRAIPQDLHAKRFDAQYVIATTSDEKRARAAARALEASGFSTDEIVVVSDRVDTVRIDDDTVLESNRPVRRAKASGRVAGGLTGAAFGALLGLAVVYAAGADPTGFALGVAVGALLGAIGGLVLGQWMAKRLARRPSHAFDRLTRDGEILVGVGFTEDAEVSAHRRAERALREVELRPQHLASEPA